MQQRYYDPVAGRFLSVDPVATDAGNGALFNRYMYAANNPYRYLDPDGRCTGSRITNSDGTCASTGGFTTGVQGMAQGMSRAADSTVTGGYGLMASQAAANGEGLKAAGYTLAGTAFGVGNALTLGNGSRVVALLKGVRAGQAGAFGSLRGVAGDGLTAHHMPQAAAGRTGYAEGGALVMTQAEHAATRTYGSRGIGTLQGDAGLSFRDVLARDIRDVRRIVGTKYNEGLRDLADYYRQHFPGLMEK